MPFRYIHRTISKCPKNRRYLSAKDDQITTAGILVIGDEILKGETEDTNSRFLAKQLHKLGLTLQKISVIPDNLRAISQEVCEFSGKYNYVLTTGGIGPTHDDLTYEGVALAFDEPLYLHPELMNICRKFYGMQDPNSVGMKLAHVPKSSRLHYKTINGNNLGYPNVSVKNVYMFPGVPELLKKTILEAGPLLFRSNSRFYTKHFYCNIPEHKIASELQQVVNEFPDVQFGCYPKMFHNLYKVKVTIESNNEEVTFKAYCRLLELLPHNCIVDIDDT
ncbi:FAD synthase-like [Anthonomus grandis grandis]|uniref:FAD synthase-like n=1 Tax=Anthonomus grandis grandis TaxID=2921223 RepID=UPI00216501EE|nr:FAD synthase-like [Anthonomus grandis grandis]